MPLALIRLQTEIHELDARLDRQRRVVSGRYVSLRSTLLRRLSSPWVLGGLFASGFLLGYRPRRDGKAPVRAAPSTGRLIEVLRRALPVIMQGLVIVRALDQLFGASDRPRPPSPS